MSQITGDRILGVGKCVVALAAMCSPPPASPQVSSHENASVELRLLGFESIPKDIAQRDGDRVQHAFKGVARWPVRQENIPGDLQGFPLTAGKLTKVVHPVTVHLIADPREIRKLRVERKLSPEQALDGTNAHVAVAIIPPTTFAGAQDFMSKPRPQWADAAPACIAQDGLQELPNRRWSLIATTQVGMRNVVGPALKRSGTPILALVDVYQNSPTSWIVSDHRADEGSLVFPLWEASGLLRIADNDQFADERNGPLSAFVQSAEECALMIHNRKVTVLAAPREWPVVGSLPPLREYVIIPEACASASNSIVAFYKIPTSPPLADDFEAVAGIPVDQRELYAVAIFSTISDEDLTKLATRLSEIGELQANVNEADDQPSP